ncbi:MAG: DUF3311 domain-containing protein [Rhodospirillales bacterium]|nr:DUF3311 domain-containing protein [Rhodospirillales bacterium]
MPVPPSERPPRTHAARILLLAPFIAMLWVSSYNSITPKLGGIPFYYWYQLLWVIIGAGITGLVYLVER